MQSQNQSPGQVQDPVPIQGRSQPQIPSQAHSQIPVQVLSQMPGQISAQIGPGQLQNNQIPTHALPSQSQLPTQGQSQLPTQGQIPVQTVTNSKKEDGGESRPVRMAQNVRNIEINFLNVIAVILLKIGYYLEKLKQPLPRRE